MLAGQISGFLQMPNFLQRFGEDQGNGTYKFGNIRSGLIVGLVSLPIMHHVTVDHTDII